MSTLTIGQLAKRVGLRTSTLRYYEQEGLLKPVRRTESGYRLYAPGAEQILRFIQRARRLGLSLDDIRTLLQSEALSDEAVVTIAEERFVALERQLTELLVLRHELELFLLDLRRRLSPAEGLFDRLLDRVCAAPPDEYPADTRLSWLVERTDCALAGLDGQALLAALRGRHVHIWREGEDYHVLVVGHDSAVGEALQTLARLEANCQAHPAPILMNEEEGYLFIARGANAFIFAQLFMALERESAG